MIAYYIGVDIGGTKCAVTLGAVTDGNLKILKKEKFATVGTPTQVLEQCFVAMEAVLRDYSLNARSISAIGISCGGPLDATHGVILSPPNLPGWDSIRVTEFFRHKTGIPAFLENDANACAVAEWKFGAGKGMKNMIFLTFGTGLGAGLILDGKLYSGTNGNAGEIGHVRLRNSGPVGYGKNGSAEGFCSGGGLAQQGKTAALSDPTGAEALLKAAGGIDAITAKHIGDLAQRGDRFCAAIYRHCGEMLGETLAILVDLFNPEGIVLGGIYMRSAELLREGMLTVLQREALPQAMEACRILPAALGESIGDYAALSLAYLCG